MRDALEERVAALKERVRRLELRRPGGASGKIGLGLEVELVPQTGEANQIIDISGPGVGGAWPVNHVVDWTVDAGVNPIFPDYTHTSADLVGPVDPPLPPQHDPPWTVEAGFTWGADWGNGRTDFGAVMSLHGEWDPSATHPADAIVEMWILESRRSEGEIRVVAADVFDFADGKGDVFWHGVQPRASGFVSGAGTLYTPGFTIFSSTGAPIEFTVLPGTRFTIARFQGRPRE